METEFILKLILISWAICGLRLSFDKGMIFGFMDTLGNWVHTKLEQKELRIRLYEVEWPVKVAREKTERIFYELFYYLLKPISGCVVCMASIWGTLGYLILIDSPLSQIPKFILSIFAISFLNILFYNRIEP